MIRGRARSETPQNSVELYKEMVAKAAVPDEFTCSFLLSCCAKYRLFREGEQVHARVLANGFCSNVFVRTNLVNLYVMRGDDSGVVSARRLFDDICERNVVAWNTLLKGEPLLVSLNNALIHMYASCGEIELAYQVFRKIQWRSRISWTSMITAFAKQGYAQEALALFERMQSFGGNEARPDEITLIGVLGACSHAGFVDEGRRFFNCMNRSWGIEPRIEHYGCMIDLLSRAGFLVEACGLIQKMPMKPNDAIWGALLGSCRIHNNAELASHVAQKLLVEVDLNNAAGYLVLLANDVAAVRRKMVEMGVKKPPGRSWVQMNGVVHDFKADDKTHKHASFIDKILAKISKHANFRSIPTMLIGNGSDVLINRAFRTAIKDEVTLTLEKAENELMPSEMLLMMMMSRRLEPWELVESERLLKEEWEQKVVNLPKIWPHLRFSLRASNVVGAAVKELGRMGAKGDVK
ncbi:hypothetical protein EZV62_003836 [Acer yangbiense]|uniref:Pentatricopeptide repeat-containing protein n=1 Tax=Acer yangbiense TaxID=1000413 RepID=A0A5C7IIE4_9ROSI|nr:hypothetical protein EZV62_003836 [Acer yangbiense]